jgi:hypothetical protein
LRKKKLKIGIKKKKKRPIKLTDIELSMKTSKEPGKLKRIKLLNKELTNIGVLNHSF